MNDKIQKAPMVPPFVRFVCSAVPMVFDDSLSYYEALCALWKWLQDDVVNVINNNATVTEEYIQLTNDMKEYMDNYFDNLDVQEEINNKLDQMAEDGTLEEIMAHYLEAITVWSFDTVADMKASTNLVNGSYARTAGFHSVGDGGGALYHITNTGVADEMYVIAVGSLYANLIIQDYITPEVLGAYGDNVHDDTTAVQACLNNTDYLHSVLSKSYKITTALSVPNYKIVDGGGKIYSTVSCFHLDGIAHITIRDLQLYPQLHAIHITSTNGWCNYNVFENIFANGNSAAGTRGLFLEVTNSYINEQTYRNCVFWHFEYGICAINTNENIEMGSHRFYECSSETSTLAGQYIQRGNRFHFYDCRHGEAISCKWVTVGKCEGLMIVGGEVIASTIANMAFSDETNGEIIGGLRYAGVYATFPARNAIISAGKVVPCPDTIPVPRTTFDADRTLNYGGNVYLYFSAGGSTDTTLKLPTESYGGQGKINQFYLRNSKNDGTSKTYVVFTTGGETTLTKTLPAQTGAKIYRFTFSTLGGGNNWLVEEVTSL